MNSRLAQWNDADHAAAMEAMLACCGSRRWAAAMVTLRPFRSVPELSTAAEGFWKKMEEPDLLEAFACHPRIGERNHAHASPQAAAWSKEEQSSTKSAQAQVLADIGDKNTLYEQQFGFTFIVCATGRSARQMLAILNRRLLNDRATELRVAAEQQHLITQIRLEKWLAE